MRKTQLSQALNLSEAFAQSGTALQTLRAITGADKIGRHDAIVVQVGIIAALALATQPPKGLGNPGDHSKVAQCFADAKLTRYAEACVGLSVALKRKGFRSMDWDAAQLEGFALADGILCELRPKVYTKAQEAERAAAKEAKAKEREASAKADEQAKLVAQAAELSKVREAGIAQGKAEAVASLTASMVADMIRAGAFDADGLALIRAAMEASPVREAIPS